jgi:hypothetical protein
VLVRNRDVAHHRRLIVGIGFERHCSLVVGKSQNPAGSRGLRGRGPNGWQEDDDTHPI